MLNLTNLFCKSYFCDMMNYNKASKRGRKVFIESLTEEQRKVPFIEFLKLKVRREVKV